MDAPRRPWWLQWLPHAGIVVLVVAALGGGWLALRLADQQARGQPHRDVLIGDGIPATFYVPGTLEGAVETQDLPLPAPAGERPAGIVLAHGHSGDRAMVSTLARSLAAAGYAVVAFDSRGHGTNRAPFAPGIGALRREMSEVLDWLEESAFVDPERLVVAGHSLGAAVALDLGSRDERPVATVAISGSLVPLEGSRPPNLLMVFGEQEPPPVAEEIWWTARDLTGGEPESGRLYGDVAEGTGLRLAEVPGANHLTVLYSGATVDHVADWLGAATGRPSTGAGGIQDPRLGTAGLYLACVLVLVAGTGLAVGRLVPPARERDHTGGARRMLLLVAALALPVPLVASGAPADFLTLDAGGAVVGHLALAGVALVAARALLTGSQRASLRRWTDGDSLLGGVPALVPAAAVALTAVYALLTPLGPVLHRVVPTPERLALALAVTALLLPFFLAFESLLRRGSPLRAAAWSIGGRLVTLAVLGLGVVAGALPGMVVLYLPVLAVVFVLVECLAAGVYRASRQPAVVGAVTAALVGLLVAVTVPVGGLTGLVAP